MKLIRLLSLTLLLPVSLWGVYAPIPGPEQGHALVLTAEGGAYFDSNIFGSPGEFADPDNPSATIGSPEQDSIVVRFAPSVRFNSSMTDRTYFGVKYDLESLFFEDRPTEDMLFNHEIGVRFAHAFSENTSLDITNSLSLVDNPESTLVRLSESEEDVPFLTDQSYDANEFAAKFTLGVSETSFVTLRYGNYDLSYNNDVGTRVDTTGDGVEDDELLSLADQLDRKEHTFLINFGFQINPETTGIVEARYEEVKYDTLNNIKGSNSFFYLVGLDYDLGARMSVRSRIGLEDRDGNGTGAAGADTGSTNLFFEGTLSYEIAENSFVSVGAVLQTDEANDTQLFTESETAAVYLRTRYDLTGNNTLFLSGALSYLSADLNGRGNAIVYTVSGVEFNTIPTFDVSESIVRAGFGLTYRPSPTWSMSATVDVDEVSSDAPLREESRTRFGVSFSYFFAAY